MPTPSSISPNVIADDAIKAALAQEWKEVIRMTLLLLKDKPDDIDHLNRLAFAYLKTGQTTSAKRSYQEVLKRDPYNQIALKNSKKLGSVKKQDGPRQDGAVSPMMFLEEPGKTKIVTCINPAPTKILSALTSGQEVFLKAKNHTVEIRDSADAYVAALPDDIAYRLIKFIAGGNRYQTIIKSVTKNTVMILIRERSRGKRFADQPSFVTSINYQIFSRPNSTNSNSPDTTPTGEEEEEASSEEE